MLVSTRGVSGNKATGEGKGQTPLLVAEAPDSLTRVDELHLTDEEDSHGQL